MSSFSDAGARGGWNVDWKGGCGKRRRWKPVEIAALVLGFALWWPLGVAVLGLKFAQRKGLIRGDILDRVRERFSFFAARPRDAQWRPFAGGSGNSAFDEWRKTEMERLEEERRKLDAAQREFAEHMDNLRRARDRDEFDQFMKNRGAGGAKPA